MHAPDLAARAKRLIAGAGLPSHLDARRGHGQGSFVPAHGMSPDAPVPLFRISLQHGCDPGSFVPAHLMSPDASVPFFPISLQQGYDPAAHFALGRALAPLRDEGVLIVGSGLSYHNLRLFGPEAKIPSAAFDAWLAEVMALPAAAHTATLMAWDQAPYARVCHKQEDHFVPLFAALGAAEGEVARMVYHDDNLYGGVTASSYRIG